MPDWMAFNVNDYVSNTLHLTARQHGGYILLICAAWKCKGQLPGNDATLMATAKLTAKEWATDGDVLKAFLTRRGDVWVHERVEFEWHDSKAIIAAKSRAGKEGAKRRWNGKGNGSAIADASSSHWQTDAPVPEPLPNPLHKDSPDSTAPASASPHGPPRAPLPDTAKWKDRLDGFRPWEGKATWLPFWGPRPDTLQRNPTLELYPTLLRAWREEYEAAKARGDVA